MFIETIELGFISPNYAKFEIELSCVDLDEQGRIAPTQGLLKHLKDWWEYNKEASLTVALTTKAVWVEAVLFLEQSGEIGRVQPSRVSCMPVPGRTVDFIPTEDKR